MSIGPVITCRHCVVALAAVFVLSSTGCQINRTSRHRARHIAVPAPQSSPDQRLATASGRTEFDQPDPDQSAERNDHRPVPAIPYESPASASTEDDAARVLRELGGKLRPDEAGSIIGLDLSFSRITSLHAPLLTLFPDVRDLDLTGTELTDESLDSIRQLSKLESLKLKGTRISAEGFAALTSVQSLVLLDASNTLVTDAALESAASWSQLRYLSLNETAVSDAGLLHLAQIRTLRGLSLINTAVTSDGVAELKKALPDCLIVAQTDSARLMERHADRGLEARTVSSAPLVPLAHDPEQLQPVVQLAAQQPELAVHLASAYSARGEWREASVILEAAASSDPGNRAIHNALGESLARVGQFDAAIAHFTIAVGEAAASYNVGLIQYELTLAACERRFIDALKQDPGLEAAEMRLTEIRQRRQQLHRDLGHAQSDSPGGHQLEVVPQRTVRPASRSRQSIVD